MQHSELWKTNVRKVAGYAKKLRIITPQPCAVCSHPNTAAHHPDYSKPLDVVWLCAVCHAKHHQFGRSDGRKAPQPTEILITLEDGSLNITSAMQQLEDKLLSIAAQTCDTAEDAETLLGVTKTELRAIRARRSHGGTP